MRLLLLAAALSGLLLNYNPSPSPQYRMRWVVQPSSVLNIEGRSNLNKFSCQLATYPGGDTITIQRTEEGQGAEFLHSRLAMPVREFECRNLMITRDFSDLLEAEQFPYINLTFRDINIGNRSLGEPGDYYATLEIQIRERRRLYPIELTITPGKNGDTRMMGEKLLDFSDFGLTPSSKMLGVSPVKEQLKIDFSLVLNPVL